MNEETKKIDIDPIQDITVQLINIAERMALIEDLHGKAWGEKLDYIVTEAVQDIAGDALADVHQIFRTLDEHTNVREFLDSGEIEVAFPKD